MGSSRTMAGRLLLSGLALAATARADEWDVGGDADNAFTTDNLVAHGAEQIHDMAALPALTPDQDWFLAPTHPFSSYQFTVDGTTGELDLAGSDVQRLNNNGATVVQGALATDFGGALSMNWLGPGSVTSIPVLNWVRVQGAACGIICGSQGRYRARFHDTTYTIPRFNNSGTQATVLLIQNASGRSCDVTAYYFGVSGAFLDASAQNLAPQGLMIVNTAASVPNQSGSVRVAHNCGYGGLAGKAVAIEPATGFTFDTAMEPRP